MLGVSILKTTAMDGAFDGMSTLKPKKKKTIKDLVFNLSLISLIDAFSILVIFLLVNNNGAQEILNQKKEIKLPQAERTDVLRPGVVVQIHSNRYFINEKETTPANMTRELLSLKKRQNTEDEPTLVVQADKKLNYSEISPVVQAGAQAGFTHLSFAVMPGARK